MTSGRISVSDGELYIDDRGTGHPLVLLHDASVDHRMWDEQVTAFVRAGYRVIRFDARGHGRSSARKPEIAAHDDLHELLDRLEISRPSLVGLGAGAGSAIDFIVTYPQSVDMAVLASPVVGGMEFTDPSLLPLLRQQEAAARAGDSGAYVEAFIQAWVDGPHRNGAAVPAEVRTRCAEMVADSVQAHGMTAATEVTDTARQRGIGAFERLGELIPPVLVLVGDLDAADVHDVAGLIEADARFAAGAVVPGTGHSLAMEQPEAFNAAVLTFLERARFAH